MPDAGAGAPTTQYVASFLIDAAAQSASAVHVQGVVELFVEQGLTSDGALSALAIARKSARQYAETFDEYEAELRDRLPPRVSRD